jgi:hypothetical protein
VARVDAQGVVTATGSGRATITASLPGAGGRDVVDSVDVNNSFVATVVLHGPFPKSLRVQDLLQYGSTGDERRSRFRRTIP